jgi:putative endonuclease
MRCLTIGFVLLLRDAQVFYSIKPGNILPNNCLILVQIVDNCAMNTVGELGEKLVLQWLQSQGCQILHHRWRCRCGEIDIIAQVAPNTIAFVEVKTRSSGNWDQDGLSSVNIKKQGKLIKTAGLFLQNYPQYANFFLRFDVALVSYKKFNSLNNKTSNQKIILGNPVLWQGYQLTIKQYLDSAFELDFS